MSNYFKKEGKRTFGHKLAEGRPDMLYQAFNT